MKYPIMNNLNTNFKLNDVYKKSIEKQTSKKNGRFFLSPENIPISREYEEREVGPKLYDKIWDAKPYYDNIHPYMSIMLNLCKKYSPDVKHILDAGAGFGNMAMMLINEMNPSSYTAYEFSKAYKKIEERFKNVSCETDVFAKSFRNCENIEKFDCVIATEIFEHICWDIEFLSKISKDTYVYFSVPTGHSKVHVRAFLLPESIFHRYNCLIDILEIKAIYTHKNKNIPKWWCVAAKRK